MRRQEHIPVDKGKRERTCVVQVFKSGRDELAVGVTSQNLTHGLRLPSTKVPPSISSRKLARWNVTIRSHAKTFVTPDLSFD